jgi:peroxiredoxin Q/BCP
MRATLMLRASAALVALAPPAAARAQGAPAVPTAATPASAAAVASAAAPAVGELAPDFTLAVADSSGARAEPVSLAAHRGRVVVLAFYPKDRTSGCTAELTRFRDEFATMFGPGVLVLPVSADDVATHAAWAREMKLPFALGSDADLAVAARYGSRVEGRATPSRTVFVIDKDGRVRYRDLRFNALSEQAYTALAQAVAGAR